MKTSFFYIAVFSLLLGSCSVKYSFTGASIPLGTETVSVDDFPNLAPLVNPTLTMTLEEALKDKFMSQTSLQLVQDNGDLHFEGSVTDYKTAPMAVQANSDVAAQNRLTITVKVVFTNKIDPEANFETTFSRFAEYESSKNLSDVEGVLIEEIVEQLVDDIFNKAVVNW